MKINSELIEKYHDGKCTSAERELVEEWLFAEDSFEELDLPAAENKVEHKSVIWNSIEASIAEESTLKKQKGLVFILRKYSVAASFIIGLLGVAVYHFVYKNPRPSSQLISIDNTAMLNVRHIDSDQGDISVGPYTIAKINYEAGTVDLAGSMLISPTRDIQLTFKGSDEKVIFKTGQTYIILNSKAVNERLVVVNERNLMDLPPVLQKQIINHFSI